MLRVGLFRFFCLRHVDIVLKMLQADWYCVNKVDLPNSCLREKRLVVLNSVLHISRFIIIKTKLNMFLEQIILILYIVLFS